MALQGNYTLPSQLTITNAYVNIENIRINKDGSAFIMVNVYASGVYDSTTHTSSAPSVTTNVYQPTLPMTSTWSLADLYTYLLTLSEFSGFTNC